MEIDIDWREKLVASLEQASRSPLRKKTACLREIYDQVLTAKANDLSEKAIIEILSKQGLHFSRSSFAVTMHRIKKEREKWALVGTPNKSGLSDSSQVSSAQRTTRPLQASAAHQRLPAKTKPQENSSSNGPLLGGTRPSILSANKGMFGDLKPDPVDGTVD